MDTIPSSAHRDCMNNATALCCAVKNEKTKFVACQNDSIKDAVTIYPVFNNFQECFVRPHNGLIKILTVNDYDNALTTNFTITIRVS